MVRLRIHAALLLLLLSSQSVAAFVTPMQRLTTKTTHFTGRSAGQMKMSWDPFSFMNDQITSAQNGFDIGNYFNNLKDGFTALCSQDFSHLTRGQIQTVGETSLAALTLLAFIQGALIMYQYSTNPAGELIAPPGLTIGNEDATVPVDTTDTLISDVVYKQKNKRSQRDPISDSDLEKLLCHPNDEPIVCSAKKGWYHVNQFLFFLLPWLAGGLNSFAVSMKFGHLLHMVTIYGLAHIYDFFRKLPEIGDEGRLAEVYGEEALAGDHPNILVLGDSMAVGIGCVNEFDVEKDSGILKRMECLELHDEGETTTSTGPVFPRVLARTISERLGKPVSWRSAGVDGGDTNDIREYLMGVLQEEVDKGQAPDLVVVLTGSNDLKHILNVGDKDRCASVRGFRSNLMKLSQEIRAMSPKTKVVYPSLPTYRLDRNSILNVFPLTLFLDSIIGFWDAQKIHAADQCGDGVYHVGLTVADVNSWYKEEERQQQAITSCNSSGQQTKKETPSLLSADGIHPNAKCYGRWANFLGHKLADELLVDELNYNSQQYQGYSASYQTTAAV